MFRRTLSFVTTMAVCFGMTGAVTSAMAQSPSTPNDIVGNVFVMTNSTDPVRGNEIAMYGRKADGFLTLQGYFPTQGLGSGPAPTSTVLGMPLSVAADGVGSQDSLILNDNHSCLFAVNSGSNTVTAFQVNAGIGLRLITTLDSGGVFPASLAAKSQVLYVLNAGLTGNLTGFAIADDCGLTPLVEASQDLTAFTDSFPDPMPNEVLTTPAQVAFTPDGSKLVISVKGGPASNFGGRIVVFSLTAQGRIVGTGTATPFSVDENTGGPFGFVFSANGQIIITHVNSFTVSSFNIQTDNTLQANGAPLSTGFPFPCWIARSGRYAYLANFGDIPGSDQPNGPGVISTVVIGDDGALSPLEVEGATSTFPSSTTANHAIDIAVVGGQEGSSFLYAVQPRTGKVGAWLINDNGSLKDLGTFPGFTPGVDPNAPETLDFRERCFLAETPDPACALGSAQGVVGF